VKNSISYSIYSNLVAYLIISRHKKEARREELDRLGNEFKRLSLSDCSSNLDPRVFTDLNTTIISTHMNLLKKEFVGISDRLGLINHTLGHLLSIEESFSAINNHIGYTNKSHAIMDIVMLASKRSYSNSEISLILKFVEGVIFPALEEYFDVNICTTYINLLAQNHEASNKIRLQLDFIFRETILMTFSLKLIFFVLKQSKHISEKNINRIEEVFLKDTQKCEETIDFLQKNYECNLNFGYFYSGFFNSLSLKMNRSDSASENYTPRQIKRMVTYIDKLPESKEKTALQRLFKIGTVSDIILPKNFGESDSLANTVADYTIEQLTEVEGQDLIISTLS
jgi:hypothetical protein